ncbi:Zinc finger protein 622 [Galdieria sulphuraria]|uniref:Zinc finger (C2H2 type) family protein n=1 Tax=Galdieria sulphuraria TaxID=130081 RepID=M2YA12_GALSU|nr:zinc finger (C2H2 type) family protein [Galdieria sulphuraria]EME32719.1 zinc finger (C2H2 type) family protein [Galdieria sulphuraria]GJD07919.1 Zinc finger protein 622 [Galdieria sulphuraria]|eukprot:XP_005709239.1 zinc finger (C2H2 type) family protein [Galdieria sulphuraria]
MESSYVDPPQTITCTACHVRVESAETIKSHYSSDWHRVNLKRKLAGLGPISFVEFETRLESVKVEDENNRKESNVIYCQACKKHFSSTKAFKQHEKSQRHLSQNVEEQPIKRSESHSESTKVVSSVFKEEAMFIAPGTCMFDGKAFEDVTTCLRHMAVVHSFRIPFWDNLEDLEGLLTYLGSKVGEYTSCVFCDKKFSTLQSVRDHMASKNHCRMKDNDEAWLDEFSEFYNFEDECLGNPLVSVVDGVSENESEDPSSEAYELCLARYRVGHRAFAIYYRQRPRRVRPYRATLLNGQLRNELQDYHKYIRKLSENDSINYFNEQKKSYLAMGLKNNYIKKLQQRKHISALNSGY